ncbi:MAG: hypothetical protein AB8G86_06835 [Saprospiraceae bacterium]
MKKKFQLVFLLLISILTITFAQVSEEEKAMSQGIHNAIIVNIPTTTTKISEKVWKNYARQFKGKTKKNRKAEEWKTTGGKIVGIGGSEPLTIYTQVQSNNDDVELSLWIPMEEGYLSSMDYPNAYKEAEKILNEYALEVRIETVKQELSGEKKTLGKLEKDLKKLKKDNDGYHSDIKNAEKDIENSEQGLVKNAEDQQVAVKNVRIAEDFFAIQKDSLEEMLSNVTSKGEKKVVKKSIRGEEKKVKEVKIVQKKAEKEEKKLRRTIDNAKKTIKDSKEKIVTNEKNQKNKVKEIAKQEETVEDVEKRLKRLYEYK